MRYEFKWANMRVQRYKDTKFSDFIKSVRYKSVSQSTDIETMARCRRLTRSGVIN